MIDSSGSSLLRPAAQLLTSSGNLLENQSLLVDGHLLIVLLSRKQDTNWACVDVFHFTSQITFFFSEIGSPAVQVGFEPAM